MEVFHQFEPWSFFDQLLDRRQPGDLIGISPRKDVAPARRKAFCDAVFAHLLSRYGQDELPPCHGLGVSGKTMIWRYPWWSVDSTGWVMPSKFGATLSRRVGKVQRSERTRVGAGRNMAVWEWLETWKQWEASLTSLWEARGVKWQT
jgi:hypothetical protein